MRSIYKAFTWRFIAAGTTAITAYLTTGDVSQAGMIAAIAGTIKIVLYIAHDKAWDATGTKELEASRFDIKGVRAN